MSLIFAKHAWNHKQIFLAGDEFMPEMQLKVPGL